VTTSTSRRPGSAGSIGSTGVTPCITRWSSTQAALSVSNGGGDVRDLLADAEAEDAERLAGERNGDAADPLAALLILHEAV
jgi:hypothetical protein